MLRHHFRWSGGIVLPCGPGAGWMFLLSSRENNAETAHHRPEEASGRLPAEVFFLAAVASSIGVMADSNFPVWQASQHITSHLTV